MLLLKKGTILYRVTDKFENYIPNYDNDTGKVGLYFANYQALALGMCLEYKREKMLFCSYIVNEDVEISIGKYGFRNLNSSLYFTEEGNFIPNVNTPEEHNISHFESYAYPIITNENDKMIFRPEFENIDEAQFGEIFLSKYDLSKIKLINQKECFDKKIKNQFESMGITSDPIYI